MRKPIPRLLPSVTALALSFAMMFAAAAAGDEAVLTKDSIEVKAAVDRGIEFLAAHGADDARIGALALSGLAIWTCRDGAEHPMIDRCAELIQKELGNRDPDKLDRAKFDVYSAGLATVFLVERDKNKHRANIECLLRYLRMIQKPHGGWGYAHSLSGDTSMTQYGVYSAWMARRAGFDVPTEMIAKAARWLTLTQDPGGGFGYQGVIGEPDIPVAQSEVRPGLTAAALGSIYACGDLLGAMQPPDPKDDKPPALKEIKPDDKQPDRQKPKAAVDAKALRAAADRGNQWFAKNFKVDAGQYNNYYFYAFERYMSLRAYFANDKEKNPRWYSEIATHLLKKQAADGSWSSDCGPVPDTAFALLFLLRSMGTKLPPETLGEGLMEGGRDLPKKKPGAGKTSPENKDPKEALRDFQRWLDQWKKQPDKDDIDEAVPPLADLPDDAIDALVGRNREDIQRLLRSKSPKLRLTIVKELLGRTRNLDNAEVLIYALTDPAPEVVREAHAALLRICRSPDAVALPDDFTEADRRLAIEKWKEWYRSVRPDAKLE
jgi:hypothetical protein